MKLVSSKIRCYQDVQKLSQESLPEDLTDDTNLQSLQKQLRSLPKLDLKYAKQLRALNNYQQTIAINTHNYSDKLHQIQAKFPQEDLKLLTFFTETIALTYQRQIEKNLSYFQPAYNFIERELSSIRGLVEIEQAKRDRRKETADKIRDTKLQNTIQAVGVGIGVGTGVAGIFSQTFPLIIEKKWALPSKEHPFLYPHPFLTSFGVSLILGAFLGWHAWRYFKQRLDSKLPPEASSTNTLAVANSKPEELT